MISNLPLVRPTLAQLVLEGEAVDQVLVVDRGDQGIELHVHGSPAVIDVVLNWFRGLSNRAEEAAAARLLRAALCPEQLDLALEQLDQPFSRFVESLWALAVTQRRLEARRALARSRTAMAMASPRRVVLVGGQNVGKSTLFNRLLCRERVLAGPTPGLTRDPVLETTALAGYPYEIVDTAGEGEVATSVDHGAVAAGRLTRPGSMLVLVLDASLGLCAVDRALLPGADVVLGNKADLLGEGGPPEVVRCDAVLSCATDEVTSIRTVVGEVLRKARGLPHAGAVGGVAALEPAQLEALLALADLPPGADEASLVAG